MSIEQGGVTGVRFTLSISNDGMEDAIGILLEITHSRSGVYSETFNVTGGNVNFCTPLPSVCMFIVYCPTFQDATLCRSPCRLRELGPGEERVSENCYGMYTILPSVYAFTCVQTSQAYTCTYIHMHTFAHTYAHIYLCFIFRQTLLVTLSVQSEPMVGEVETTFNLTSDQIEEDNKANNYASAVLTVERRADLQVTV